MRNCTIERPFKPFGAAIGFRCRLLGEKVRLIVLSRGQLAGFQNPRIQRGAFTRNMKRRRVMAGWPLAALARFGFAGRANHQRNRVTLPFLAAMSANKAHGVASGFCPKAGSCPAK